MLLNELNKNGKIDVFTTQPLCIYTKTLSSYSECWNNITNTSLNVDDIDESYGLDIEDKGDIINVYIPINARCVLKRTTPNVDCTIFYKNIECDLIFEDEPIDSYFEILE